jgi:hypothetical protein
MKPLKSRPTQKRPAIRKGADSKTVVSGRKNVPRSESATPPVQPVAHKASRKKVEPIPAAGGSVGGIRAHLGEEILGELQALRTAVTAASASSRTPDHVDADLESGVDSMRRLLSELIERRMDSLLGELTDIRQILADPLRSDPAAALSRLDRILDRLGATSFSASPMEFVDPAIHDVAAEKRVAGVPDGVVVETLRAGWRSASGALIAKACVAVNRRPSP